METAEIPLLPIELWTEILLRIPADDLVRLGLVCKRWHHLIRRSRSFAQSHLDRWISRPPGFVVGWKEGISYFNFETGRGCKGKNFQSVDLPIKSSQLLASCDGLLLIRHGSVLDPDQQLHIYNPATGSMKNLPTPRQALDIMSTKFIRREGGDLPYKCEWAIVRDAASSPTGHDIYKVFVVLAHHDYWPGCNARYCWRYCFHRLDEVQRGVDDVTGHREGRQLGWKELYVPRLEKEWQLEKLWGVEAITSTGGKLHLLLSKTTCDDLYTLSNFCTFTRLLSLDITKEEFRASHPTEPRLWINGITKRVTSAWNGAFYYTEQSDHELMLWELINLDDDLPAWIPLLIVPCDIYPMDLAGMRDLLVVLDGSKLIAGRCISGIMYVYDMIIKQWSTIELDIQYILADKVFPHVYSLLRLSAVAEAED